jgi:hypothetical protein
MLTTVDWALGYAKLGWRVFPVWPGEKRPIYRGWPEDATTDPAMVTQYFKADPTRNIGIVCGESFDAWDIEVDHVPALAEHMTTIGAVFPESPVASTGRGGMHLLTEPTGVNHTRQLHLGSTHIGELKSTGGFIVVAPSVTVEQYRWTWVTRNMTLSAASPWMLELLERPPAVTRALKTRLASPDDVIAVLGQLGGAVIHAGEGKRNSYLYWAMRRALEDGVPARHAGNVLKAAGIEAGLEPHEVKATIRSAYDAESVSA